VLKVTEPPNTRGDEEGDGEAPGGRAETVLDGDGDRLRGAVFVVEGVPVLDGVLLGLEVLEGVTLGVELLEANSAPITAFTPHRSGFVYVTLIKHPNASLKMVSVTLITLPHFRFTIAERVILTKKGEHESPFSYLWPI
jgi:hypothetical protein